MCTSQRLQERVTEAAKVSLKERIDGQATAYRKALEIDRIKMDQSVGFLNEAAFAQVEKQVRHGGPSVLDPSSLDCCYESKQLSVVELRKLKARE